MQFIEHVIPIAVSKEDDEGIETYFSRYSMDEEKFKKMYTSIRPDVTDITPYSHYHSEPFLTYYLLSESGKQFLVDEFYKKGLTKDKDGESGEYVVTNIKDVTEIGIDMHSSRVICFNCAPFLQSATPKILKSIYSALALSSKPKEERLSEIKFNVSANTNFDWRNISSTAIDHVPVSEVKTKEGPKVSILSNTENELGKSKTDLQKVGETSNRTVFISGSYALGSSEIEIIELDRKKWEEVTNEAATKIQNAWRKYKQGQEVKLSEVSEAEDEVDILATGVAGVDINRDKKPSSAPKKSEDSKSLKDGKVVGVRK